MMLPRSQDRTLGPGPPPSHPPRFEHSCAFYNFSAACFRFEPGLGVESQSHGRKKVTAFVVLVG